ncbi:hypothetical protein [Pseudalkalibacillus berkeleyi]|uniref:Uncharacterized protein n=1 Tax=Pseudalkalibacillus berkeleyi TaxID=1069813 RepID=A0ABS9GU29_9BACL|nr:hypothetical protein [Pseudalkalibacillus berkeleyi]MCF6136348.1 hypothetical protein [Pseudalkalibacillus berkeleyi]
MKNEEKRLRDVQALAYHVTDAIHLNPMRRSEQDLKTAVDQLSRAVGILSDSSRCISLDEVEEKVNKAYQLIVKRNHSNKKMKIK